MALIWVVESDPDKTISVQLLNKFAVRHFGSISALGRFLRSSLESPVRNTPKCVLLVDQITNSSLKNLEMLLEENYSNTPCLFAKDFSLEGVLEGIDEAISRSNVQAKENLIKIKDLKLNLTKHSISIDGLDEHHVLSGIEFKILRMLISHRGACVSRELLKGEIWDGVAVSMRTIDTHVSRLRKKISASLLELRSMYGKGYILS